MGVRVGQADLDEDRGSQVGGCRDGQPGEGDLDGDVGTVQGVAGGPSRIWRVIHAVISSSS